MSLDAMLSGECKCKILHLNLGSWNNPSIIVKCPSLSLKANIDNIIKSAQPLSDIIIII